MGLQQEHVEALTRRALIRRAGVLGLGAMIAQATDLLPSLPAPVASAATPLDALADPTLAAFADTMIPGRKVARTESGKPVDPRAIAGVDPEPGAVEADVLDLYHHPNTGFDTLAPAFLADLEARALRHGGRFLDLGWDARVATCRSGLDFGNPTRVLWEAAAAVPFTAFCAAAVNRDQTARTASGYRVMGLPGRAPNGYRRASYRRKLARERTKRGNLR